MIGLQGKNMEDIAKIQLIVSRAIVEIKFNKNKNIDIDVSKIVLDE